MPNLLYPYLIGFLAVFTIPLFAIYAFVNAYAQRLKYQRLEDRLPQATRFEDLSMRVTDLERQRDDLAADVADAERTIAGAQREREWMDQHREEIIQMRAEAEQLAEHRLEYDRVVGELADAKEKRDTEQAKLQSISFDYELVSKRLEEARDDLQRARSEVESAESTRRKLIDQVDELQAAVRKAKDEEATARRSAEAMQARHEALSAEVASATEQLETIESKARGAEFDYDVFVKQRDEAREELNRLHSQIEAAEAERRELRESLQKVESQLRKATDDEAAARRSAEAMQARHEALCAEVAALKREKEEVTKELKSARAAKMEAVQAESAAKAQLAGLRERIDAMRGAAGVTSSAEAVSELYSPAVSPDEYTGGAEDKLQELAALDRVQEYLRACGLRFDERTVLSFHTALKTSLHTPLLVLAGISGTGKSLLPRRYAEAMGMHFLNVPVQPRWDGPQDIIGFFNHLEGRYKATDLIRALIQFDEHSCDWLPSQEDTDVEWLSDRMLLVLLDEMNLARVEYYFSEFLSRLETRRDIDTAVQTDRNSASVALDIPDTIINGRAPRVFVGSNVLLVGTMNEDESTLSLSDKVIDRAAVSRFGRPTRLTVGARGQTRERPARPKKFLQRSVWDGWRVVSAQREIVPEAPVFIERLNEALALIGRPFAYRTNEAMIEYVRQYPRQSDEDWRDALADQIEQRIMPRLRGIDVADQSTINALDKIARIAGELGDQALQASIEAANEQQHLFNWTGVQRDPRA